MADAILTLNAGSSSLKFALFEIEADLIPAVRGQVEGIQTAPHFHAADGGGRVLADAAWPVSEGHEGFLGRLLAWIESQLGGDRLAGVGHRVVHGGAACYLPQRVDDGLLARLEALVPMAPLHQPHNLAPIRAVAALRPGLPQYACFDTAFHHTMAPVAARFALPRALEASGVRRYGFHGLSYEYIAGRLRQVAPALAGGKVVVAHLGNGASLCALEKGRSVDTTMGFSALDGLVMGTRCGALDPGVLLYLLMERGFTPDRLQDLLYQRSGLLGISEISSDMRTLLASGDPRAAEALDLFVFHIARELAAMAATLKGLDALVFTAGIGENSPEIRKRVCRAAEWLGLAVDEQANAANGLRIGAEKSRVAIFAIPTDEEIVIARHTRDLLGG